MKIKVYGAVARHGSGGAFTAVCRDSTGLLLGASAIRCRGISGPAILEALACREGLALANDLGATHVVIASDCKGVVQDITNNTGGEYGPGVREIRETSTLFQHCTFTFEGRETNIEAHRLARHALGLGHGRHLWLIDPPDLNCIPMNLLAE